MTTHITFRDAAQFGGASIPSKPRASETMTESGASAQTTITARLGEICRITTTVDIMVNYGANPTAAVDSGDMVTAGGSIDIGPMSAGDKVAIITA